MAITLAFDLRKAQEQIKTCRCDAFARCDRCVAAQKFIRANRLDRVPAPR